MSKAVILQHVPFETPGRIIPTFRDFGIPTEVRHLYRGDQVPTTASDLDEIRILIVMGGPMSVSDIGSDKYPFLAQELELLKTFVAQDRPVLGICLGAQLLAHAAGAKVYPNAKPIPPSPPPPPPKEGETPPPPAPKPPPELWPEFGWFPVTFPFPGGTEPIVMGMVDGTPMFHWHNDTFDLPRLPPPPNAPPPPAPPPPTGNALMSASRLCRNQAFRFKNRLFGFQYHMEMTRDGIAQLIAADKDAALKVLGPDAISKLNADTETHYPRYERAGNKILQNLVQFLKQY